jgi:Leucine-rich repeat (LRR) protein
MAFCPPRAVFLIMAQILYLGGNRLLQLPDGIGKLSHLSLLYLGDNKLSSLPSAICNLRSLRTLNIHDNELTVLPPEVRHNVAGRHWAMHR